MRAAGRKAGAHSHANTHTRAHEETGSTQLYLYFTKPTNDPTPP